MKILILTDGKYGDRAVKVIKKKFPETSLVTVKEEDASMILDYVELEPEVEIAIEGADLIIAYVRHPDVVSEICSRQKPTILPIDFGEGFLNQERNTNPRIVMPISMCNALPNTGIQEIDNYFNKFGMPIYNVKVDFTNNNKPIVKEATLSVESPCGASFVSLDFILGKELSVGTLNSFAINVRQECREPVSFLLSHNDMSESSAALHLINLLKAIEKVAPSLFKPGTSIGEYAKQRREEFNTKNLKHLF
ncbi:MAG: hypothetical protein JW891_15065 [Candidatus Lokiarchaeota archaeon]|nr:hypothetical protein [Candidatus Lokiarchaeota archaeon]